MIGINSQIYSSSDEEIAQEIGADGLVYQDIDALKTSVRELSDRLSSFDASCFDGCYITGDISPEYLDEIEAARNGSPKKDREDGGASQQMHLNLMSAE